MNEEKETKDTQVVADVGILDDLDDTDKAIISLKIGEPAITNIEIGKRLSLSRETIHKRLAKVKVNRALRELQKTAFQVLVDAQTEAARKLITHMKNENPDISLKACREILRGVLSDNINVNIKAKRFQRLVQSMSDEQIDEIFGKD